MGPIINYAEDGPRSRHNQVSLPEGIRFALRRSRKPRCPLSGFLSIRWQPPWQPHVWQPAFCRKPVWKPLQWKPGALVTRSGYSCWLPTAGIRSASAILVDTGVDTPCLDTGTDLYTTSSLIAVQRTNEGPLERYPGRKCKSE